jgi:hypothetical protein
MKGWRGGGTDLVTAGDTEAEGGYAGTADSNAEKADELFSGAGARIGNLL